MTDGIHDAYSQGEDPKPRERMQAGYAEPHYPLRPPTFTPNPPVSIQPLPQVPINQHSVAQPDCTPQKLRALLERLIGMVGHVEATLHQVEQVRSGQSADIRYLAALLEENLKGIRNALDAQTKVIQSMSPLYSVDASGSVNQVVPVAWVLRLIDPGEDHHGHIVGVYATNALAQHVRNKMERPSEYEVSNWVVQDEIA